MPQVEILYYREGEDVPLLQWLDVRYRMLYFFHERAFAVISHGFSKQQVQVPPGEIDLAVRRRLRLRSNPTAHSFNPRS